ncbi:MAG: hypothetical protein K0U86_12340 [Planctomycetes bacterium]|nr:hypothetical protein [Planctomycetota bacterium]MCH9725675.1 hypothetical protein [Planctomycetota bacterium]MCH9777728.1 hypothetical protein [Planctomycetota bacterium]MCH9791713.1 hypothetical protein [Planctomycetota bacterium]
MNQSEVIEYLKARGADVFLRKLDASQESEIIRVLVGRLPVESSIGIQGWESSIYLTEVNGRWRINYRQAGITRPLDDIELKSLLDLWIEEKDHKVFRTYVPS